MQTMSRMLKRKIGGSKEPQSSAFSTHLYEVFVTGAKHQPATFTANKIDKGPLDHLDIQRTAVSYEYFETLGVGVVRHLCGR